MGKAKGKKNFYAAANGNTVGIFTEWLKCSESVNGFKGASFQGFQTWLRQRATSHPVLSTTHWCTLTLAATQWRTLGMAKQHNLLHYPLNTLCCNRPATVHSLHLLPNKHLLKRTLTLQSRRPLMTL
jgi:hypothetical protein